MTLNKENQDNINQIHDCIKQEIDLSYEKYKLLAISNIHESKLQLDQQRDQEIRQIKYKYDILQKELIERQKQIIQGDELSSQEVNSNLEKIFQNQIDYGQKEIELKNQSPIFAYWHSALLNNDEVGQDIEETDDPILEHLEDIQIDSSSLQPGVDTENWNHEIESFKLIFKFSANEYFKNTELTKEFIIDSQNQCIKTIGCDIDWFEGKNVCVKKQQTKQKNKKTGEIRNVMKNSQDKSFFNFFQDTVQSDEENDIHFDIGTVIKDDVVPNNIEHFFGLHMDKEGMNDDQDQDEYDQDQDQNIDQNQNKEKPECKQQ